MGITNKNLSRLSTALHINGFRNKFLNYVFVWMNVKSQKASIHVLKCYSEIQDLSKYHRYIHSIPSNPVAMYFNCIIMLQTEIETLHEETGATNKTLMKSPILNFEKKSDFEQISFSYDVFNRCAGTNKAVLPLNSLCPLFQKIRPNSGDALWYIAQLRE